MKKDAIFFRKLSITEFTRIEDCAHIGALEHIQFPRDRG